MQLRIKIPEWATRRWDKFGDWANVSAWRRGPVDVRRIDLLISAGGVICVVYYWLQGGWLSALAGGLFYVMIVMISLWFF